MPLVRGLGKFLLWTAIGVIALVGALLLVNAVDEDLKPEVAAALKPAPSGVPEQENGYFVIAGFNAPAGQDPHAYGRRWLSEIAAASPDQLSELRNRQQPEGLEFKGMKGRFCSPLSEPCFDKARRNPSEVRRLLEANAELFQRYESLYRYPRLDDVLPTRADAPFPAFSPILNAQSLKLAQIALMIEDGRISDAVGEIERDLAFQRRFAVGASSLINLMIAQVTLANDYLFIADVLRAKREAIAPQFAPIATLLAPQKPTEEGLRRMLHREFRFAASMIRLAKERRLEAAFGMKAGILDALIGYEGIVINGTTGLAFLDPFVLPFLKERATLNMYWSNYGQLASMSLAPAGRFAEEHRALLEPMQKDITSWRMAYNPVGKLLVVRGLDTDWPEYLYRIHDVDGLGGLVSLQAQLLAHRIPDSAIPQFLAAGDKSLFDPYTGKPMQWDATARQLWFKPQSVKARRDKIGGREDRIAIGL